MTSGQGIDGCLSQNCFTLIKCYLVVIKPVSGVFIAILLHVNKVTFLCGVVAISVYKYRLGVVPGATATHCHGNNNDHHDNKGPTA